MAGPFIWVSADAARWTTMDWSILSSMAFALSDKAATFDFPRT